MAILRKTNRTKAQAKVSVKKVVKSTSTSKAAPLKAGAKVAVKSAKPSKPSKLMSKASPKKVESKGKPGKPDAVKAVAKPITKPVTKANVKTAVTKQTQAPSVSKKSTAASAAAVAVQKVSARLSGRVSPEVSGDSVCREVACEGLGTTAGYCRLHYIKNWRKIKRKEVILKEGKLNIYIEELVSKYPEKYLEAIRHDLANDKEFAKVLQDLDLDESIDDFEGEGSDSDVVIDSIKREFDDDSDAF